MNSKPSVVSTFSGTGGSSLGYEQAGCKVVLAVEFDKHAQACYRLNFPKTDLFAGDIHDLSVDAALERTGLGPGELDIFDGSPPCQGFSSSGTRNVSDPRNQLFGQYVRLLSGFAPRAFVMENVAGIDMNATVASHGFNSSRIGPGNVFQAKGNARDTSPVLDIQGGAGNMLVDNFFGMNIAAFKTTGTLVKIGNDDRSAGNHMFDGEQDGDAASP